MSQEKDELRARFTKYICKIIVHAKIDYLRNNQKHCMEISLDTLETEPMVDFEEQYETYTEQHTFSFEEEKLAKAFSDLPLMRQKVLEMLFVEQLTAVEIAQRMNCSLKYVYDQKYLALHKLRKVLGGEPSDKK